MATKKTTKKSKRMKIAWIIQGSFAPSSSYYQQVHLFARRLNDFGHTSNIINITSIAEDRDEMLRGIKNFGADVLINFGDVHFLDLAKETKIPLISWVINGTGLTPVRGKIPMTTFACVSKFAQKVLENAGVGSTRYFPFGFNPNLFHPGRRASTRARLEWAHNNPTVLMISTNLPINPGEDKNHQNVDRKNWVGGLEAFADFLKLRPDARLYIHANEKGLVNIPQLITKLGIQNSITISDQKFYADGLWNRPPSFIADLYRASNVLLFPSLGEGFGIPLIEAQACGIPVVTTNGGPMTELAITGTAVKSAPHPAFPAWRIPDRQALVEALAKWIDADDPWEISRHVQNFSVEAVIEDNLLDILKESQHG